MGDAVKLSMTGTGDREFNSYRRIKSPVPRGATPFPSRGAVPSLSTKNLRGLRNFCKNK